MNQESIQIERDMVISLSYLVSVNNDSLEQNVEKQKTVQVIQGRQQVAAGLEQALYGMRVGDEKDITVEPSLDYGEINPDAIKTLPRNSVPSFATATRGQRLRLLHKKSGEVRNATVLDVQTDTIVLDFNHPFAGKTLNYHLRINDIRPATAQELELGTIEA